MSASTGRRESPRLSSAWCRRCQPRRIGITIQEPAFVCIDGIDLVQETANVSGPAEYKRLDPVRDRKT
jgi:hypothetical protein